MSSPSPQLPLGQVIGSRYRIQSLIGRGGMGMVYAAMHELTGRRVALKLMLNECDDSPVLQERFLSEARIAAAVRHPNIVDVLDMGLHGGSPFLVMELLEGVSLERFVESQQRLSIDQALNWLFPIIGALSVLHEAGIVHRDVKPSNIFMSSLPRHPMRPKLLDFGLARVVSDLRLTRSGTVIGTPLYMAPEHAAGQVTGPQADVWSIGVVLYEALAGCSPFNYTDRASLAMQVIAGIVRPLQDVRPDIPPLIATAVGRALQRDLSRRYPDMRSFAHALHAAARASNIPVPPDPDPIGLPEYASWQSGERHGSTTLEQHAPSDGQGWARAPSDPSLRPSGRPSPSPSSPATSSASGSSAMRALSGSTSQIARMLRGTSGPTRLVWLGLLATALVLAATVTWKRTHRPEPYVQTKASAPATSRATLGGELLAPGSSAAEPPAQLPTPTVESLVEREKPAAAASAPDAGARPLGQPLVRKRPVASGQRGGTRGSARDGASRDGASRDGASRDGEGRVGSSRPRQPEDEVESEWK